MIYLYSGTPGSGKSLHAAYKIIDKINQGKGIIANYNLALDHYFGKKKKKYKYTYLPNDELTISALVEYAKENHKPRREHQTLLVIDECSSIFNCRSWDKNDRSLWIEFFQRHRKMGYDVLLICQNDRMIDRQIRGFIETEFKHRKIENYMIFGFILSKFLGGMFISIEYWYGAKLRCGSEIFLYNNRKAKIYDTFDLIG